MNDERHDKGGDTEKMVYGTLILSAAIALTIIYLAISASYDGTYGIYFFGPPVLLAFAFVLLIHLFCLFMPSWSLRRHLLIWYGCLFAVILISTISHELAKLALVLGAVVLFILPVIWLTTAGKTPNDRPQPSINAGSMGDDNQGFEFAKALYLARKVDREAAQLIVQAAEAGLIQINEATDLLIHLSRLTSSLTNLCDSLIRYAALK